MSHLKKITYIAILLFFAFILTGCSSQKTKPEKTTFHINEAAEVGDTEIILNDVYETKNWNDIERENDTYLIFEFRITNHSKSNLGINSANNFKLLIDGIQYPDMNNNSTAVIQQDKSLIYQVVYDVPEKDNYDLIFIENNGTNIHFLTN